MGRFELVKDNSYLVVEIPAESKALPFRVLARINSKFDTIDYGLVPIESGASLPTLDGGTVTASDYGVLPGRAYIPSSSPIQFSGEGLVDSGLGDMDDMFYISRKDFTDRILHVYASFTPSWTRVMVDMPLNVVQSMYQNATLDIYRDFGFARGNYEIVFLPGLRGGWRFANDTNLNVYLYAKFIYGEYKVEVVKDPEDVFNLLTGKLKAHWVTLPVNSVTYSFTDALNKVYGFDGYPLMPETKKDEAINTYKEIIQTIKG